MYRGGRPRTRLCGQADWKASCTGLSTPPRHTRRDAHETAHPEARRLGGHRMAQRALWCGSGTPPVVFRPRGARVQYSGVCEGDATDSGSAKCVVRTDATEDEPHYSRPALERRKADDHPVKPSMRMRLAHLEKNTSLEDVIRLRILVNAIPNQ